MRVCKGSRVVLGATASKRSAHGDLQQSVSTVSHKELCPGVGEEGRRSGQEVVVGIDGEGVEDW
jgi:hypothetical protein